MQPFQSIPGPVHSARMLLPLSFSAGFGADNEFLSVGAIRYFTVSLKRLIKQPRLFIRFITTIKIEDDYHKKRMDMLAYSPVEINYLEVLAKIFHQSKQTKRAPPRKQFQQGSSWWGCYFNEYKIFISLDHTLKFHSKINNLISVNLEYLEKVSQS